MNIAPSFSKDVAQAKENGDPIVALESTIITHGMPHPQNVECVRVVEAEVRQEGAVPATIAVIKGKLRVGMTRAEIERLAAMKDVAKLSRADLAVALARGWTGATTVAATMIAARHAGISVFATGGIGGVHQGGETSFDISADLHELAQSPVIVVASGAKAILDLPKTLEVLETLGVPVIAYGQDEFPAFWSRSSGLAAPLRMNRPSDVAQAFLARRALGLTGGQLIANPIPKRAEIAAEELAPVIETAIMDANNLGVSGKSLTPFLLDRIYQLTGGKSLAANIELIRANARLAAKIAVALAACV